METKHVSERSLGKVSLWKVRKLKLYVFEMQKWNTLTDKGQWVDEKNGIIRLVIFTPRVRVIKMSKTVHFMFFLLDIAKYQSQFGQYI